MSLVMKIESELDERSATAAANRAERVYAEASKNISKSLSSQIGDGAQAAGKAVEKMADSARASYQKVLKAQDELAQQERQLKQMREDGARGVEVQAERVRQARRAEKDAIREAAGALSEYERAVQGIGESGTRAGLQLRQGLRSGIENGLSDVTRQFGALGSIADNAFSGISRSGGIAALGVAGVGLAAVTVAQQLYQLGQQWDAVGDKISMRTGKFDGDLTGITDSVKRVASDTAAPIEAIGDISGQVVQSMKLAGPELDAMTQRLAILQEAGNPVGVRDLAKAYNVFGIEAKDQADTLDRLFNVSQNTGIPLQELVSTLTSAGRATKQFGLDAGQTAGLLATLERAGLNGDSATKALTIALKNFSNEGKEAGPALSAAIQRIQDLSDAGRDSEAAMVAAATFGGKSYLDMLNAIKDHRLTPDELSAPFDAAGKSIPEAADKVEDFAEKWQKFKNNLSSGPLAEAGSSVFDFLNGQMQQSIDLLKNFNTEWDKIATHGGTGNVPLGPGGILGYVPGSGTDNGVLIPGGGGPGAQAARRGGANDPVLSQAFGNLGMHLGIGGRDLSDWPAGKPYWGNAVKDATSSGSSGVAVPYGPGYGRAPRPGESTAMYSAEQAVLEAEHRRATAEAELAKVMADGTHTTNDQVKAQNEVAQAKKAEIDANMRLHDTSVKAAESLNKATGQLSEFGANIDADFGASKGLPGILENIVKFAGNLALAGPMAQMNAISAANPNQGSGLMGILGSTGAFGPQYTPQAIAAASGGGGYGPSAMGPAVLRPGGGAPSRAQVDAIAASFGLTRTSGDRNEPGSYHNIPGAAGDYSNGSGNTPQELAFAKYMSDNFGPYLKELIYSDPQFSGLIGDGQNVTGSSYYSPGTLSEHRNHVHVGGLGMGGGTPGSPSRGLTEALQRAGIDPAMFPLLSGFSAAEGNNGSGVPTLGFTDSQAGTTLDSHAQALAKQIQDRQSVAGPFPRNGTPQQQAAWMATVVGQNGAASDWQGNRQPARSDYINRIVQNMPGAPVAGSPGQGFPLPWALGGGPLSPAIGSPGVPTFPGDDGAGISSAMPGQIGPFAIPGAVGATGNAIGAGRSIVGAGRTAEQSQPTDQYGVAPATSPGGGGIGITPGGTVDTAIGIAASAANLFAPGAGAAAQAGIKLASRAIQYGGQVAGIAADGLMQTFLPAESQKAQSGWLQRGVGALASVKPALPNIAGGKSPNAQSGQGAGQGQPGQQGQPPAGNTYNTTVNSTASTITGAAKDAEFHFSAQNQGPGW